MQVWSIQNTVCLKYITILTYSRFGYNSSLIAMSLFYAAKKNNFKCFFFLSIDKRVTVIINLCLKQIFSIIHNNNQVRKMLKKFFVNIMCVTIKSLMKRFIEKYYHTLLRFY